MRKLVSLLLAIMMVVSVAAVAANAEGADTATVTITGFNNESSDTKTYKVGETFTAYVALNTSRISEDGISALKATQNYDSSILELADAFSAQDGMVEDLEAMFPVCGKGSTIANAKTPGIIKYNSSTPNKSGYKYDSDEAMLIVVNYTVKAAGTVTITNPIETLSLTDLYLTKIVNKGVIIKDDFTVTVSLSEPVAAEGSTVSGTITSFKSDTDDVTVQLLNGETVAYETTVHGNEAAYSISDVADGSYTLRVSKKDHVYRDYDVTVSGDTVQDATILLLGDVDGNGELTTLDYARVNSAAKGVRAITDPYILRVADVIADGEITTMDATRVNAAAKGARPLW